MGFKPADYADYGIVNKETSGQLFNRGLLKSEVDNILSAEKGLRPNPETYLPSEYIDIHLTQFEGVLQGYRGKCQLGQ